MPGLDGGTIFSPEKIRAIHDTVEKAEIAVAFQPIVDVHRRRIYAYETLARPKSQLFSSPTEMFQVAVQAGRVAELARLHRERAVDRCHGFRLFLNIDPNEFDHGWLVRPDDPMFRHRWHVTLEITESVPIKYFTQCHGVLAEIRRKGVELAIDDFGAGFSNLKYIADLAPEIVKLDRELITGITPGTTQARLVASIVSLCHEMGAQVVAEGVENAGELTACIAVGVDLAQGYIFGRPADPPPDAIWPGTQR